MSTHGMRRRHLLNVEVFVERSFDDYSYDDVSKQVNDPRLVINIGRFNLVLERRPLWRWRLLPLVKRDWTYVDFDTPWFCGQWFLEDKDQGVGPTYMRSGDWTEHHDRMVD